MMVEIPSGMTVALPSCCRHQKVIGLILAAAAKFAALYLLVVKFIVPMLAGNLKPQQRLHAGELLQISPISAAKRSRGLRERFWHQKRSGFSLGRTGNKGKTGSY